MGARVGIAGLGVVLVGMTLLAAGLGSAERLVGRTAEAGPRAGVPKAQCEAAIAFAIDVAHAEVERTAGREPNASAFGMSSQYATELEAATAHCKRASEPTVKCLLRAESRRALAECGPFWAGE